MALQITCRGSGWNRSWLVSTIIAKLEERGRAAQIAASGTTVTFASTADTYSGVVDLGGAGGFVAAAANVFNANDTVQGDAVNGVTPSLTLQADQTFGALRGDLVIATNAPVVETVALTVGALDTSTTQSGQIGGALSLTKVGSGTLTLSGANTYTSATTVSGGVLAVDGSIASAATVNSGGTLGGTGTTAAVTVAMGGFLSAGDYAAGASTVGHLTTGAITLAGGAHFAEQLGGAAGAYDQVTANGNVALGGATLDLSALAGFTPTSGTAYDILHTSGALTGQFAQGASVTAGGYTYAIAYTATDVTLIYTAPPPPPAPPAPSGPPAGAHVLTPGADSYQAGSSGEIVYGEGGSHAAGRNGGRHAHSGRVRRPGNAGLHLRPHADRGWCGERQPDGWDRPRPDLWPDWQRPHPGRCRQSGRIRLRRPGRRRDRRLGVQRPQLPVGRHRQRHDHERRGVRDRAGRARRRLHRGRLHRRRGLAAAPVRQPRERPHQLRRRGLGGDLRRAGQRHAERHHQRPGSDALPVRQPGRRHPHRLGRLQQPVRRPGRRCGLRRGQQRWPQLPVGRLGRRHPERQRHHGDTLRGGMGADTINISGAFHNARTPDTAVIGQGESTAAPGAGESNLDHVSGFLGSDRLVIIGHASGTSANVTNYSDTAASANEAQAFSAAYTYAYGDGTAAHVAHAGVTEYLSVLETLANGDTWTYLFTADHVAAGFYDRVDASSGFAPGAIVGG